MCMFCKCDTVKQSTTTHVVNYKNSIIVIKNVPVLFRAGSREHPRK